MRLQLHRLICWFIFSFCISLSALADERSSMQKIERETAVSSTDIKNNKNKPVLAVPMSIQSQNEQESEAIEETELRNSEQMAFASAPPSPTPSNKQDLALSASEIGADENKSILIESNRILNPYEEEIEAIAEAGLRNGEQVALARPLSPKLKIGREQVTPIAKSEDNIRPVFIEADFIQGHNELEVEGIGDAKLQSGDQVITANRMKYYQDTDDIEIEGDVRVEQRGDVLEGSQLKMNLESKIGQMDQPNYSLRDGSSRGGAKTVQMEGEGRYRFLQAHYTTCPEGNEDWVIQTDDLEINDNEKVGTARHAKLKFMGIPIGYTPWLNFSYSGERKTGFLAPIYSSNSKTGFDVSVPFYLNIAPNLDATIKARGMTKRGIMANSEIRYLTKDLKGKTVFDILPDDIEAGPTEKNTRYRVSVEHDQKLDFLSSGLNAFLSYNKVSDDDYFRDLGKGLGATSRTNLLQQGLVSYNRSLGQDGILSISANVERYQTIQQPLNPIDPPYRRLPEIILNATQLNVLGANLGFSGSWTDFSHPLKVDGKRYTLHPTVSVPLSNTFGYIKPKIGVHHTGYDLGFDPLNPSVDRNPNRTLPLVSLDSGTTIDREITLGGEQFTQTIEPRFFYTYVPFKKQNQLPTFDSSDMDFSFARLFTENRFSGNDRINDANRITMALTSRLIESDTGKERFRIAVGQQINLQKRRVEAFSPKELLRDPDLLLAFSGYITPTISADTTFQFNEKKLQTEVIRSRLSYQPEPGKALNLGYRFTRGQLEQGTISSIWPLPLIKGWHSVGRINYSFRDSQIIEGLAGLEYNACCWTARFVMQHLTTSATTSNTQFYVQLELNGLLQIGSNPLKLLGSIPGYTKFGAPEEELR